MTDQNPSGTTPPSTPPAYEAPAYSAPAAPAYGNAPAAPYGAPVQSAAPGKVLGIVAFVLSFFVQLIALILGIVALVQSKKAGRGNGWAVAAIIISSIALIIGVIVFFTFILPSLSAATTCLNDPTGIVTVWGVQVPCSEVVNG